jgi:uncharacterized membrane protein
METDLRRRQVVAGLIVGVGTGMFLDGIVFHQILQWHHLLSSVDELDATTRDGLSDLVVADGWFHVASLAVLLAGVAAVWSIARLPTVAWPASMLAATVVMGIAGFDVADALVNHLLLNLHNLREDVGNQLAWDLGYLGVSLVVLAVATAWLRAVSRRTPALTAPARSARSPRAGARPAP